MLFSPIRGIFFPWLIPHCFSLIPVSYYHEYAVGYEGLLNVTKLHAVKIQSIAFSICSPNNIIALESELWQPQQRMSLRSTAVLQIERLINFTGILKMLSHTGHVNLLHRLNVSAELTKQSFNQWMKPYTPSSSPLHIRRSS